MQRRIMKTISCLKNSVIIRRICISQVLTQQSEVFFCFFFLVLFFLIKKQLMVFVEGFCLSNSQRESSS